MGISRGIGMLASAAVVFSVSSVDAASIMITGSGTGVNGAQLEAKATFDVTGDFLTITLQNIADNDEETGGQDTPGNTLTGLFFDISSSPSLSTVSATIPGGSSIIQAGTCNPGPCTGETDVSGEWGFSQSQNFSLTGGPNAEYGIASPGYLDTGLPMNIGNFNNGAAGSNLDDPNSLDGINFGIVSSAGTFNPNGGLASDPLIQDSLVLVLSGATGISLGEIANVSFQYGTGFGEPNISAIPVPAAVWLFGSGLIGLAGVARRRKAS